MKVSDQIHAPVALIPGKSPLVVIMVGEPQIRSGRCGKRNIFGGYKRKMRKNEIVREMDNDSKGLWNQVTTMTPP
jgi:hypothetical protein